MRRIRPASANARLAGVILLLALLVLAGTKIWRVSALVRDIGDNARELSGQEESAASALSFSSGEKLRTPVLALAADFRRLHSEIGPLVYLGPLLGWLPGYGSDLAQAPALLDLGMSLTDGAETGLVLVQALYTEMDSGRAANQPLGACLIASLANHGPEIARSREDLEQAQSARVAIDAASLSPQTRAFLTRIDHLLPSWNDAVNGLDLLPGLLGAQGAREYLLLVQNSDELRPTGGFISSVVRIRVDRGDIQGIEFADSYAVDNPQVAHPDPPAAIHRYMFADTWLVRDANWSPDFPTSAADVARIYALDRGIQVDGVIGTNLTLVPRLLEATGPVTIDGSGETMTAANALDKLKAFWASPQGQGQTGDWWDHRKDLSGQLLVALLQKIRQGDFDRAQLLGVLAQSLQARDLLLYARNADLEAQIRDAGWSGSVANAGDNRVMVVDSNVGFNKVDPNVTRTATLDLTIDESGKEQARLDILYNNSSPDTGKSCEHGAAYLPSYSEMQQGCYWNYLRVVLAPGAQLISSNLDDAGQEDPIGRRSVLWGYLVIPRAQSRRVEFEYKSPSYISSGGLYRLRLEKQPGAPIFSWHIKITLPSSWIGYRADPMPIRVEGSVLEYDVALDQDWEVQVRRQDLTLNWVASLTLAGLALLSAGAWYLRNR